MRPLFEVRGVGAPEARVLATAVHAGHELRPEVAAEMALAEDVRRREEDPYTDRVATAAAPSVVVHRSRFEVDLNRDRANSVYERPDDAWGLDVWAAPLDAAVVARSRALHDEFYTALGDVLDRLARTGPFVVLDVHSYNHRRTRDRMAEPVEANPEVNVGTGSMDRTRWGRIVDRFTNDLRGCEVSGHRLDVRENVRFRGGHLAAWVHERYPTTGCALAIELKKTFMDEWSGALDPDHLDELGVALAAAVPGLVAELEQHG